MSVGRGTYLGTALAALLAAVYLIWDPQSADLAAQVYRTTLWNAHGFVIYNPQWYSGHHVPGYSLLTPPLFGLLGPRLAGAIAAVVATFAFERIAHRYRAGTTATLASLWFAVAMVATTLVTGRLTFAVGAAVGLAALAALPARFADAPFPPRGRGETGASLGIRLVGVGALSAIAGLMSPLAGAFLALAWVVWGVHTRRLATAAALALAATGPAAALVLLFPEGGSFPFVLDSALPTLIVTLVLLASIPAEHRLLRLGTAAVALLVAASAVFTTPVGGNATRIGVLLAGSIAILALWPDHRRRLLLLAPVLVYWQISPAFDDWQQARSDPSVKVSYYEPLRAELLKRTGGAPTRIEVPFTDNHWESRNLTASNPSLLLARGWERQLDRKVNPLFYKGSLTATEYSRWLKENAISYVALPDAPLDYSAAKEAQLIRKGLPTLRAIWAGEHWRLFAVRDSAPLADNARVVSAEPDRIELAAAGRGPILLRFRYSRYFRSDRGGPVARDPNGPWMTVDAAGSGLIILSATP